MQNFRPNRKRNLCLVLCGKATWALAYSIAVLLVLCVLVNGFGNGAFAVELLKFFFQHIMQVVNVLLCGTILGSVWEAITSK